MSPEDEGPNSSTSPSPAILDISMNNHNNDKYYYDANKTNLTKAKWLDSLTNGTDENRNAKVNGLHNNNLNHKNKNGTPTKLSKTSNSLANTTPSPYINGNGLINGNGKLSGPNGNTNTEHSINNLQRRDSATNVLSPLLERDTITTNINDNNTDERTIQQPLHDSLPELAGIYGPTSNNNGWNDSVERNNLKNNFHKIHPHHNNNGSLTNGKNGLGIDKLHEHDPLTGDLFRNTKSKHFDDGFSSSDNSYGNTTDEFDFDGPACGLFGCRPKWARKFASTHMFMVVFLLAWVCIGMFSTYFVSIITTIEKLFQIKSRTTGMLLSASELGQISTALLLSYYAGRGHRPRWIACGMVLFSIAAFSCALPHFIFGDQLMQSNLFLNGNGPKNDFSETGGASRLMQVDKNIVNGLLNDTLQDTKGLNLCSLVNNNTNLDSNNDCEADMKAEQDSHSKITVIVLCIFFFSLLSAGIGNTAVSTLGIPYIDDNVASRESPIYLSITIGVRILGPAAGFIVGSFCTRVFVNLTTPDFDASDPRWISAWWLGPVLIGTLMLLASIAMFSFPKQLHGSRIQAPSVSSNGDINKPPIEEEKPKLKDFPRTVRRQLGNDILMFRTASSVCHILPIAGLYTFLPKYLETQFRLAASDANLITAFGGILVMGIGIMISGILIPKINPSAKSIAAWIAFTALMYSAGMAILMFVGCNMDDFVGLTKLRDESVATFAPSCNVTCNCDVKEFSPICGIDGKTYFSSCHAGCSVGEFVDGKPFYTDCECIPNIDEYLNGTHYEAIGGYCDSNCKNFILFICVFAFCVFIHSTSEVGGMLVIMRCTDPKDKAMAMGVIQSAIGLFGNVPCPIIYGAVVDSACLVWTTICGKHGACSLYDVDSFRHYFLGITSGIMFIAFIMDLIVWSKAHRIDIAPSDADASSTETELEKPISAPDTSV